MMTNDYEEMKYQCWSHYVDPREAIRNANAYHKWYSRKLRVQKIYGIILIIINLIIPTGAAVFMLPMGLWMLLSRRVIIY